MGEEVSFDELLENILGSEDGYEDHAASLIIGANEEKTGYCGMTKVPTSWKCSSAERHICRGRGPKPSRSTSSCG